MLKFGIILAALAVFQVAAQTERQYRLYTVANRQAPVNMSRIDSFLPNEFKRENKTIILIHGHGGGVGHEFNTLIMREIFEFQGAFNVIVVDWENEARHSYSTAVSYVPFVANELSGFIRWLVAHENSDDSGDNTESNETGGSNENSPNAPPDGPEIDPRAAKTTASPGVDVSKLHLVGFGLGAHIAGIASRQLRLSLGVVGRITGLDPSGSSWGSNSQRLRNTDAHYVEVLHTDGSGPTAYGIGTSLGHKDFHANGGANQPGCLGHSCSHNRAYEFFAASMQGHLSGTPCRTSTQLTLNLCRGTAVTVGGTDLTKPGYDTVFRVNTGRRFPF